MSRIVIFLAAVFSPLPAFAHVGHVGELAGHDHWIAIAALGVAAAVWAAGKLKGRAKEPAEDEPAEAPGAKTTET